MKVIVIIGMVLFSFLSIAQKQKVIFDCDLAGDVDDAYALALLLTQLDKIELLGIVTDHGLTKSRALVAAKILEKVNLTSIPIYIGRETKQNLFNKTANGEGLYSRQMFWAKDFKGLKKQKKSGADFILETIKKYPREVTLITLGPVPTIGDVIKKDSLVLRLAKNVVCMLGSFYKGYGGADGLSVEYNVMEDLASSKLLAASGANITYIGLDVTDAVKLNQEERQQLFMRQTPLTDAVSALYALWRGEWGEEWATPTLYDAAAVGYVLWPELFKVKKTFVEINDQGFTIMKDNYPPTSAVALEMNQKEFMKRFMESLLLQNLGNLN